MKIVYAFAISAGTFAALPVHSQISYGGHPYGITHTVALREAPLQVMPTVDAEALMAEDAERTAQGIKGPYRFGLNHATDLSLENSGTWQTLSNGDRVWRLAIQCPGAYSINFEFHDYVIPEGAQVFVYNELGDVLGAFEEGSNSGNTVLGVTQLAGDKITIEYVEPLAVRGLGRLMVGQVTHGYRDIMHMAKGLGDSGSCNNNVICPVGNNWRDQINSVAMITVGGGGICTGTLINNCAVDGTPYFLTANHCLGGNNTWVFRFNWESPSCGANQNGPTTQTISGSTLKASSQNSDVALLRLNATPPASYNVYYSGWDKSTTAPTASTCIHHPSGDIKKISFDNNSATQSPVTIGYTAQCWKIAAWDDGTTEGGSSGSGLWNQNGLLIGQLFGGQASCENNVNDYFGRFNVSYPLLQQWLGSCGTTLQGYDPATVGIADGNSEIELSVLPNPTTGMLSVVLPSTFRTGATLKVFDMVGKVVLTRTITNGKERISLDLTDRTEGVYILQVENGDNRATERILLTH